MGLLFHFMWGKNASYCGAKNDMMSKVAHCLLGITHGTQKNAATGAVSVKSSERSIVVHCCSFCHQSDECTQR